ncbi:MAG: acyl dehydratase, partial [Chloroflexi bacterium]|nr:acyl dehydratase [Chloroflexota bacterium]
MDNATLGSLVEPRYFEDYVAGTVYEFGSITVEEAEVIDFARRFY